MLFRSVAALARRRGLRNEGRRGAEPKLKDPIPNLTPIFQPNHQTLEGSFSSASKPIFTPNTHFAAFFENYKICNPLHRSNFKISAKFRETFSDCFFLFLFFFFPRTRLRRNVEKARGRRKDLRAIGACAAYAARTDKIPANYFNY